MSRQSGSFFALPSSRFTCSGYSCAFCAYVCHLREYIANKLIGCAASSDGFSRDKSTVFLAFCRFSGFGLVSLALHFIRVNCALPSFRFVAFYLASIEPCYLVILPMYILLKYTLHCFEQFSVQCVLLCLSVRKLAQTDR